MIVKMKTSFGEAKTKLGRIVIVDIDTIGKVRVDEDEDKQEQNIRTI